MDKLIENLQAVVGPTNVLSKRDELLVYECDGLPHHKYLPRAVVFPSSTEETSGVMSVLADEKIPFTPRGAGTGLSGGALALTHGVVIELARLRRILKIDEINRYAIVQPGVVNSHVSRAVAHLGLHYVPDPSSQPTCTIGGNIAESAGGIHCLKYGTTTDHVLGIRVVLAGGEIVEIGGNGAESPGYDLTGVFVGSEGTFGIATEATLRLTPIPPSVRTLLAEFAEVDDASHAVSAIIAAGVMPAALEMMDREIIRAVEASVFAAGLSLDIGAALLIELDGLEAGIDDDAEKLKSICLSYGARSCRSARDEAERRKLWAARKGAFGAIGRISPDSMIQDAVVPRSKLPAVLGEAYRISAKYQLLLANVFHAGDGNLHPLICFDSRSADEVKRVKEAGRELMEVCVAAGGSITGEHGVGFDKRELLPLIFSDADMDAMLRVRAAFDPTGLCNPGKIIPMLRGCGEARAVATSGANGVDRSGFGEQALKPSVIAPPQSKSQLSSDTMAVQLSRIVGEANVEAGASVIVAPESIDQVCEVMKLAASKGWTITPAGAASWLDTGNLSGKIDLTLSTRNLKNIIDHEPADLVAVTEAGVTLNDFNLELARKGQWLPLDPPNNGSATIGGVVATGLAGAQQIGYGAPRRHVIGMKVVLADGTLIKAGGRVVKNVAGYDLCKLFTGSYGTLGVIVEVNFKLRPLPFETSTVAVNGSRDELLQIAARMIRSRLFPVAAELMSPQLAVSAGLSLSMEEHHLWVRFAGSPSEINDQCTRALEMLNENNAGAEVVMDDSSIWQNVATLPSRFDHETTWRASVRLGDLSDFLTTVHGDTGTNLMWHASVGDGRIRVIEKTKEGTSEDVDVSIRRLESLRNRASALRGSLILENASPELKRRMDAWGVAKGSSGLMRRIKRQLDPNNRLSPGRFSF